MVKYILGKFLINKFVSFDALIKMCNWFLSLYWNISQYFEFKFVIIKFIVF